MREHDLEPMVSEHALVDWSGAQGSPLDDDSRAFFQARLGRKLGDVRVHAEEPMAQALGARAFTAGRHIVFAPGHYRPRSAHGRRLIAHELVHVMQQEGRGGAGWVQLDPETWYRGEAAGVGPARPGSVIHDFGDGLYLTDDPAVAAQYARLRAGEAPAAGRVLAASFERNSLGRVLDLSTDPRWTAFMRETTPSGVTCEQLIRQVNENYWSFFQAFLRRHGLSLDNFDTIIGPEYVRGGRQMCIRTPGIAARIQAMLGLGGTGGAGAAPTEGQADLPVRTRFNVLETQQIPGGRVVSEVEVTLGDGLEAVNARIRAGGGAPLPSRLVLRITTDANGALVAVESSSVEAASLAEALARQALGTAPEAAGAGAASGAAGTARAVSPWVRGAVWGGWVLFAAVTAYRVGTARPEDRPRVLTRAAGGLAGAAAGGYVVCNLLLGIETVGWSLLICGGLVGLPAGAAGEAVADVAYEEATIDDNEIRAWVSGRDLSQIALLTANDKLRLIFSLMQGWISDEDVDAIARILAAVRSRSEMDQLRRFIEPHLSDMSSIGQRTRIRVSLARL